VVDTDVLLGNHVEQGGTIVEIADKIDFGRVHDQKRTVAVIEEEVGIGVRYVAQVLGPHQSFFGAAALVDATQKHVGPRLQVDDQIGRGHAWSQRLVDAVVKRHLLDGQGERREEPVLGEKVVRDNSALLEKPALHKLGLLPVAG
jgi:hypothetical protein